MPPSPQSGKARALCASLRLPNLPSVWSNTLTGAILASLVLDEGDLSKSPLALLAATCLYFAGNLFNDWADLEWDRKHRPERALPSGIYDPALYRLMGVILVAFAMTLATLANLRALSVCVALLCFILIYTWCHKRTAWSVIPMALCRASLPILGYYSCSHSWNLSIWACLPSLLLFIYLILLSLRARTESQPHGSSRRSAITSSSFVLPALIVVLAHHAPHASPMGWPNLISVLPYLIWSGLALSLFRTPVSRQVSALLAGIPLVDAMCLLPYLIPGHFYMNHPLHGYLACSWLAAFILGRALQRYVPAT